MFIFWNSVQSNYVNSLNLCPEGINAQEEKQNTEIREVKLSRKGDAEYGRAKEMLYPGRTEAAHGCCSRTIREFEMPKATHA